MNLLGIIAVLVLLAGTFLDIYSTRKALSTGAEEANPIARWIMKLFGNFGWASIKVIAALLFSYLVYLNPAWSIGAFGAGVLLLTVGGKNLVIAKLRKRNKK